MIYNQANTSLKELSRAAMNAALDHKGHGERAIAMSIIYLAEALTEAIGSLHGSRTNQEGRTHYCRTTPHPIAQAILPGGKLVTITPDPDPPNPTKTPGANLSIIHVLDETKKELADPHGHQSLAGFMDWADRQEDPKKPIHIQSFHANGTEGTIPSVAYTTKERIKKNAPFLNEDDRTAIRQIIDQEVKDFADWTEGKVCQATVYRLCPDCGHPETEKPLATEKGFTVPIEEIIKEMRKIVSANQTGGDHDVS